MRFQGIAKLARTGDAFRKVMQTGRRLQVVLLSLRKNETTGEIIHAHSDQFLFVLHGDGETLIGARLHDLDKGDGLFIAAGTRINIRNTGDDDLKILEIFSPPIYPEGWVQGTREDAPPKGHARRDGAWAKDHDERAPKARAKRIDTAPKKNERHGGTVTKPPAKIDGHGANEHHERDQLKEHEK